MASRGTAPATVVALDIGGSSVKSGRIVDGAPDGQVAVTPLVHTAPRDEVVARLAAAIRAAQPAGPWRVAAAVPDPFDHAVGMSLMTHKLAALYGQPLGQLLEAALGQPLAVRWCNDAAAAIVGEAASGAGAAYRRVLGVTLGTGLGAAFVADGAPLRELGGQVVGDLWDTTLPDGRSADSAFSARSLLAAIEADPDHGGEQFGRDLAALLAPLVGAAQADVLVIGGGGAGSFDAIAETAQTQLGVPVVRAALGAWAPLLGAVRLCFPA